MKTRRILLVAAIVAVLAVVALGAWLFLSIDGIVAREIERAGSKTTGTTVNVAGVNVRLDEGNGIIRSLRVANPPGFSRAAVVEAKAIRFDVDLRSLRKQEPLVIDEVVIEAPTLRFEIGADRRANLDVIAKHAAGVDGAAHDPPKRLRIDRFVIRGARIDADATAIDDGKREMIAIDDIVLTNVGGRDGGTPEEVTAQIVAVVQRQVMRAVAKEGFNRLLKGQEEDLKGKMKEKLEGLFGR